MTLSPNSRLGVYQIAGQIGAGGMGEVYRAHDTTLGRDVALKILPASVSHDPDRLARFEREAKLLAALNHPNVAMLHALERIDGQTILVMELAAGEDLTSRIDRGPIPLDEALAIAVQVALALEAAHEKGIVHRDLKPANIKLGPDGTVKVLDFGLAKALAPDDAASASAMNSPTLTAHATQAGIILGTAAYMSPEQARGRAADKRADVWSFGVVLFEMLAGARLFQGETISDTLAAVLRQEIDWKALPPNASPPALRQLLRRCLERDRKNRLHDIADARIVLEEIARDGGGDAVSAPVARSGRRMPIWTAAMLAAVTLAAGVLIGRALWNAPVATPAAGLVRFVIPAPAGVTDVNYPAMAPDAGFVVFEGSSAGQTRLYAQRFDEVAPHVLDKTEGGGSPFISSDGRWVGFWKNARLEKVPIDGGDPVTIAELTSYGPGAAWGPDGTIVFSQTWLGGLASVPADGGKPHVLTTPDTAHGEKGHWWPQFLPGGRGVLFTVFRAGTGLNDAKVAVLDLASGKYRELLPGAHAFYVAPGFIVFHRAGAYHAVRFDLASMTTGGEPVRMLEDARALVPEGDSTLSVALGTSGTLAYRPGQRLVDRTLAWVGAGGKLDRLPFTARPMSERDLSPDGQRLAVTVLDAGRYVLRILDFGQGTDDLLDLPGSNEGPVWHPDSRRLAFNSMRKGDFDLYLKDTRSSGLPEPLLVTDRDETPTGWTPDGDRLVIQQSDPDGEYRLKLFDPKHPETIKVLTEKNARGGSVSPDGLWFSYRATPSGRAEIYVKPLSGDTAAERVSKNGGTGAQWALRTHEIYYARPPEILAAAYQVEGGRFRVTAERVVVRLPDLDEQTVSGFLLAPDGRILIAPPAAAPLPPQFRIVINWQREIERRLSAGR